jgi:predicted lipoprotein
LFAFGPLDPQFVSLNIYSQIDTASINEHLRKSNAEIDTIYINNLPSNCKGFIAIEYLLYGSFPSNSETVRDSFIRQPQRASYLRAVCDVLQNQVNLIMWRWSRGGNNDVDKFIRADGNDQNSSLNILVASMVQHVRKVANEQLAAPLGMTNGGIPQPELVDGRFSGESMAFIAAEIKSVENVLTGLPTLTVGTGGINTLLDKAEAKIENEPLSEALLRQIAIIYNKIGSIDTSLSVAVVKNTDQVSDLQREVVKLKSMIEINVINSLYLVK